MKKLLLSLLAIFAVVSAHADVADEKVAEAKKRAGFNSLQASMANLDVQIREVQDYLRDYIKGQAGAVRDGILQKVNGLESSLNNLKDSGENVEKKVGEIREKLTKVNAEIIKAVENSSALLRQDQRIEFQKIANNFGEVNRVLGGLDQRVVGTPIRESVIAGSLEDLLGRRVVHPVDFNIAESKIESYYLNQKSNVRTKVKPLYPVAVKSTQKFLERALSAGGPVVDALNDYQLNKEYKQVSKTVNHIIANFYLNASVNQIETLLKETKVYDQRKGTLNVATLYGEALSRNLFLIQDKIMENKSLENAVRSNKFIQHNFKENYKLVVASGVSTRTLIWRSAPHDKVALRRLQETVNLAKQVGSNSVDLLRNGVEVTTAGSKKAAKALASGATVIAVDVPKGIVTGVVNSPKNIKSGVTYLIFKGPKDLLRVVVASARSGQMKFASAFSATGNLSKTIYFNVKDKAQKSSGFIISIGSKFTEPFVVALNRISKLGAAAYNSKPVRFFVVPAEKTLTFVNSLTKGNKSKKKGKKSKKKTASKSKKKTASKSKMKTASNPILQAGAELGKIIVVKPLHAGFNLVGVVTRPAYAVASAGSSAVSNSAKSLAEALKNGKANLVGRFAVERNMKRGETKVAETPARVAVGDSLKNKKQGRLVVFAKGVKGAPGAMIKLGKKASKKVTSLGKAALKAPKKGFKRVAKATKKVVTNAAAAPKNAYKRLGRLAKKAKKFAKRPARETRARRAGKPKAKK